MKHAATQRNYDRMARWYDLFAASEVEFTELGLQLLDVRPGERVLEIGFGTGHALIDLATKVGEAGLAAGLDLSAGMIAVTQKRIQAEGLAGSVGLSQGDATQLPLAGERFDAILLSFTLELFPMDEIPIVLAECRRVLKPGGRLGVVSLEKLDRLAVSIYEWFHRMMPRLIDCRPIRVERVLQDSRFEIAASQVKVMWGLPVMVCVATK